LVGWGKRIACRSGCVTDHALQVVLIRVGHWARNLIAARRDWPARTSPCDSVRDSTPSNSKPTGAARFRAKLL
jgi:hypothetical protein